MRAFVTGATGFVGTNLVRLLVDEGWDVTAIHRATSRTDHLPPSVRLVVGEIVERGSLAAAMPEAPDVVFHVAGDTTLWSLAAERQTKTNVTGTRNVVAVAVEKGAKRLVHTSSVAAYGHHEGRISEESSSNAARSPINYYRTKWLAEQEIRNGIELGLDAVMINPHHIIGPWDWSNWSRVIRMVWDGTLPGVPPGTASWCHVREVARAHLEAAARGHAGANYLLGGTDASYLDAIRTIGEITGKPVPGRPVPGFLLKTVAALNQVASYVTRKEPDLTPEGARMVCESAVTDCSKAVAELGYRRVPLREMFEDCFEWMRMRGMLGR